MTTIVAMYSRLNPFRILRRALYRLRWTWIAGGAKAHKSKSKQKGRLARWQRNIKWVIRIALLLLALDIFYIMTIWPSWSDFKQGPVAKSEFIKLYQTKRKAKPTLPRLRWHAVPLTKISKHMQRAVVVAEDARFYQHSGFDVIALKDAMDYNLEQLKMKYGASTISQQTVKNMFFSASRNPLRKWHELIFTVSMEFFVPKERILETYLNIAEFGQGIFGVEAASQYYWNIPASRLSLAQATELAATLPSPKKHNPKTRTGYFTRHAAKIYRHMR